SFFQRREKRLTKREKRESEERLGAQRWTRDELRAFFDHAPMPLRAQLGLMYYAGYGASDCADLYDSAIKWTSDKAMKLPGGWGVIHFPRPKTEIERAAMLPASVMADLKAAREARP